MAEIKNMIFGIIIGIFFITVIIVGLTKGVQDYGGSVDDSQLSKYNKLSEINNLSNDIRSSTNSTQQSSTLDILGDFFKTGYKSVKITEQSIDVAQDLTNQGVDDMNLGENANNFKSTLIILIILMIAFAIISILVGREL